MRWEGFEDVGRDAPLGFRSSRWFVMPFMVLPWSCKMREGSRRVMRQEGGR